MSENVQTGRPPATRRQAQQAGQSRNVLSDPEKIAARTKEYETSFMSPFKAAERGYIDEVIMPHSTRRRIARALSMLRTKTLEMPEKKHDNLPL